MSYTRFSGWKRPPIVHFVTIDTSQLQHDLPMRAKGSYNGCVGKGLLQFPTRVALA